MSDRQSITPILHLSDLFRRLILAVAYLKRAVTALLYSPISYFWNLSYPYPVFKALLLTEIQ